MQFLSELSGSSLRRKPAVADDPATDFRRLKYRLASDILDLRLAITRFVWRPEIRIRSWYLLVQAEEIAMTQPAVGEMTGVNAIRFEGDIIRFKDASVQSQETAMAQIKSILPMVEDTIAALTGNSKYPISSRRRLP
ncbi:hypothetical protein H0O00_00725 [Candidatus Micrarchaeota archaeon]|nr:hypothetical protein [Candidatus Micrarchaeota archaeon]